MATTTRGVSAIRVRGARQNNLKNLNLDIPLNKITVITGVSGSGKSSLAFDTLYSEGQRLYVETFSAYTRQFLDRMDRPSVDTVDGIPPAIAIDQTNPVRTSRSTVGTMTELNDHLKLLFARAATLYCRNCGKPVHRDTAESVLASVTAAPEPERIVITFPVTVPDTLDDAAVHELVSRQGFRGLHVRKGSTCHVIQDRLKAPFEDTERVADSIEQAFIHGHGKLSVWALEKGQKAGTERPFSADLHCAECDIHYGDPTPNLFSFNSPIGACETCRGFGRIIGIDYGLVVPDESLTLKGGAIKPWQSKSYAECQRDLLSFARKRGIRTDVPWAELSDAEREWVIDGEGEWDEGHWYGTSRFFDWLEGRSYRMHVRVLLSRYRSYTTCPACLGARLKPDSLNWRVGADGGQSIHELVQMPISDLVRFMETLSFVGSQDEATRTVMEEINRRLRYLDHVGLGYLDLDRQSRTLSGGEVQRVNLTTALGTSLVNALFVLDEPSIGLHPRDVNRLIEVLHSLRDSGNTIVVVEHDPAVIQAADHVIDLGPAAGADGGEIVFQGAAAEMLQTGRSLTGQYLAGRLHVLERDWKTLTVNGSRLKILGARQHNLKSVDVEIPLGCFVAVTGVSGSGKSTLVEDVIHRALCRKFGKTTEAPGAHDDLDTPDVLADVVLVDQAPIGKSARSNPASYVGAFDAVRAVFAALPASKERGYTAGTFSFNSAKGQCPTCKGSGFEHIEMQFLSDVYLRCPECGGSRFRHEVLEIELPLDSDSSRSLSVAGVLEITVDEAALALAGHPRVIRALKPLQDVGLGYVTLGQPVPTLSGGEAQRLKLAAHLAKAHKTKGHTLFLFDEPTTGLHFADIRRLLHAFASLRDAGNSIMVIEHNLDVIAAADWVIDLGPEGGADGGRVVFAGTTRGLKAHDGHTGRELAHYLSERDAVAETAPAYLAPVDRITIRGAHEHNLRGVDITLPHNQFTVLTGVSGSGKSTVAFDIVFAEGQRRYLESLNAYARQFVQPASRAEMDGAVGIPPAVAIEQRTSRGGQKSTVATVTEIYQFLRLLFARLGIQYCPEHGIAIQSRSEEAILESIKREFSGEQITLLAPLVVGRKGYYTDLAKWAAKRGQEFLRVDGEMTPTADWPRLDRYREHDIELPLGPVKVGEDEIGSLLSEALNHGNGAVHVLSRDGTVRNFSTKYVCPRCSRSFEEPDPRLFSYNSKQGRCAACLGTGVVLTSDERSAVNENVGWDHTVRHTEPCPECEGTRLRPEARSVRFHGMTITDITGKSIREAVDLIDGLDLTDREHKIADDLIREMRDRLQFLIEVGLGYLSLDRSAPTLSGGEAQRIRLAAQLGSRLRGVCYVLDEPTIGLHPRDNRMLLAVLRRLTNKGNTVLVVEHDAETIEAADYVVDLGPGGGVRGGTVVADGSPKQIRANPDSVTGRYLKKGPRLLLHASKHQQESERNDDVESIRITGAIHHNLKNITVEVPRERLVVVTGVSGSGKSTLVRDVLFQSLKHGGTGCDGISGHDGIERVLEVDQTPIGKTPRSTPATYIKVWDEIRKLFASLPDSRMRGYTSGRFSFNTAGGRCEVCGGQGVQRIEMSFLPDVNVICDSCNGRRYNAETLAVRFKDQSIADVLAMNVEEAVEFFASQPKIRHALSLLNEVGLGYLTLGQSSPTLSGGEAQRIKLVAELARSKVTAERLTDGREAIGLPGTSLASSLYVLDEPTVGLHMADVDQLITVLKRLVSAGASVVVIEHNMEVIAASDWVIDLGPEGGEDGGELVAAGSPQEIARNARSYTGRFLESILR